MENKEYSVNVTARNISYPPCLDNFFIPTTLLCLNGDERGAWSLTNKNILTLKIIWYGSCLFSFAFVCSSDGISSFVVHVKKIGKLWNSHPFV